MIATLIVFGMAVGFALVVIAALYVVYSLVGRLIAWYIRWEQGQ